MVGHMTKSEQKHQMSDHKCEMVNQNVLSKLHMYFCEEYIYRTKTGFNTMGIYLP